MPKSVSPTIKSNSFDRVAQLDGLRGIAILFVILNHLRFGPIYSLVPVALHPVLSIVTGSGKTGVMLLFMLSGYLMATIYPMVPSILGFWQKRYARIFPPFLAMATALIFIRIYWKELPVLNALAIVAVVVVVGGLFWRLLQKLPWFDLIGKIIFRSFLIFQLLVVAGYAILQTVVSPAVYFQVWPIWVQYVVNYLTNITMTLPFGSLAPQLDGVYWSVIAEVIFYLLYPILVIPAFRLLSPASKWIKVIAAIAIFPFLYGVSLLFSATGGLGMLNIQMIIYFIAGTAIGYLQSTPLVTKFHRWITSVPAFLLIIFGMFASLGLPYLKNFSPFGYSVDTLAWVIPTSLLLLMTLEKSNLWSRLLRTKWLVFAGKISYSLYLTHTIAIELMVKSGAPNTLSEMWQDIGLSLGLTLSLALLVHFFLELPYFAGKNKKQDKPTDASIVKSSQIIIKSPRRGLESYPVALRSSKAVLFAAGVALLIIGLVWKAYRAPTSFTSRLENHQSPGSPVTQLITTAPITFSFTATKPNLGMLLFYLRPLSDEELKKFDWQTGTEANSAIKVIIKQDSTVINETLFPLFQLYGSRYHPVGLPAQTDSAGKTYQVELSNLRNDSSIMIGLINQNSVFHTVYQLNKSELLRHPLALIEQLFNLLAQPFFGSEAQFVLLAVAPLLILIGFFTPKTETAKI